jgi:ATP-dependent DNA helicase RecQ
LVHIILRSYTGLFTDLASINEETIAQRLQWTREEVYQQLVSLAKEHIVQYIPRKKTPYLTYTHERVDTERVALGKEAYDNRRERYIARIKSVLDYAQEENFCRNQVLLTYFGEKNTKPCGKCDICLKHKKSELSSDDFDTVQLQILDILRSESMSVNALVKRITINEKKTLQVIRFLLDNDKIMENQMMKLEIKA